MIRVVVVDDQALLRVGVGTLLRSEPDTELIGEAADGCEGLAMILRTRPDAVLSPLSRRSSRTHSSSSGSPSRDAPAAGRMHW